MGSPPVRIGELLPLLVALLVVVVQRGAEGVQWCVARSGASEQALQAALDYACGAGSADCQPIQPSGLCYLPNSLAAHASYAFNSFYQRSRGAPGSCDFAGTATISITDPSYGSCTFPSSASTAGGSTSPPTTTSPNTSTPITSPVTTSPTGPGTGSTNAGGIGGLTPVGGLTPSNGLTPAGNGLTPSTGINGFGPTVPNTDLSGASTILLPLLLFAFCYFLPLLL